MGRSSGAEEARIRRSAELPNPKTARSTHSMRPLTARAAAFGATGVKRRPAIWVRRGWVGWPASFEMLSGQTAKSSQTYL